MFTMFRRIVLLAGAALAALAITTAPAHADASVTNFLGTVVFKDYGEHVYVYDGKADGHGVRAYIDVGKHGEWVSLARVYNGNGYHKDPAHKNLSIAEGRAVLVEICSVDGEDDESGTHCQTTYTHA